MFESIKNKIKRNKQIPIRPWCTHYKPIQWKLPEIKIVGNFDKEDIDEAHDAIVSFLVEKIFNGHDCHVFKYKGITYIRMKPNEPAEREHAVQKVDKTTAMPYISIHQPAERRVVFEPDGTIRDKYSRKNDDRYKKKKKEGK